MLPLFGFALMEADQRAIARQNKKASQINHLRGFSISQALTHNPLNPYYADPPQSR